MSRYDSNPCFILAFAFNFIACCCFPFGNKQTNAVLLPVDTPSDFGDFLWFGLFGVCQFGAVCNDAPSFQPFWRERTESFWVLAACGRVVSCGVLFQLRGHHVCVLAIGSSLSCIFIILAFSGYTAWVGISSANSAYFGSLPLLTDSQEAHMQLLAAQNQQFFRNLSLSLIPNLTSEWSQGYNATSMPAPQLISLQSLMASVQKDLGVVANLVQTMRSARNSAAYVISVQVPQISDALNSQNTSQNTSQNSATALKVLDSIVGYYNFSALDASMIVYNSTVTSIVYSPSGANFTLTNSSSGTLNGVVDDLTAYLGNALGLEMTNDTIASNFATQQKSVSDTVQVAIESLKDGMNRCFGTLIMKRSIPQGAFGLVKFSKLISLLDNFQRVGLPLLICVSVLLLLVMSWGVAAWNVQSPNSLVWVAFTASFAIIIALLIVGFALPVSILTDDTCRMNPSPFVDASTPPNELYASLMPKPLALLPNTSTNQLPASCAACDKFSIENHWSDFGNITKYIFQSSASVASVMQMTPPPAMPNGSPTPPFSPNVAGVLVAVGVIQATVKSTNNPSLPRSLPWSGDLASLNSSVSAGTFDAATFSQLARMSFDVQSSAAIMHDSFLLFQVSACV